MNRSKSKNPLHNYAWYTSIAFQMLAIILLSVFGGIKLDAWLSLKVPVFTVLFSVGGVILAIYLVTKDIMKGPKR